MFQNASVARLKARVMPPVACLCQILASSSQSEQAGL